MELIVGNNVINMVALVPNIVVQPDSAAQVQDITLMVIVPLKWKKLLEIQFMPIVKITFVLLGNQKKRVLNGTYRKKQIVRLMISIPTH